MTVWFMIIVAVGMDLKQAHAKINIPNEFKYNNEKACRDAGEAMASDIQTKLGSNNFKVFWDCQSFSEEEINKALPPRI